MKTESQNTFRDRAEPRPLLAGRMEGREKDGCIMEGREGRQVEGKERRMEGNWYGRGKNKDGRELG